MKATRYCLSCGRKSLRHCGSRTWDAPCSVCSGKMRTTSKLPGRQPTAGVGKPCRLSISLSTDDYLKLARVAKKLRVSPAFYAEELVRATLKVHA